MKPKPKRDPVVDAFNIAIILVSLSLLAAVALGAVWVVWPG